MNDDISRDDLQKFISGLQGLTGAIGKLQTSVDRGAASPGGASEGGRLRRVRDRLNQAERNMDNRVRSVEHTLSQFNQSLRNSADGLRNILRGVFGGAFVGAIISNGTQMARTLGEMNEIGQNFGGSLMEMHKAAAQAGLPLADFADLMKRNSAVVAQLGQKDFARLALSVRKNAERNGMYGYTVEALSQQMGDYMETSRLYGTLEARSRIDATDGYVHLAEVTSTMATATGKARTEITALANEAMRGTLAIAGMLALDKESRAFVQKNMEIGSTVFAAQQGEAGKFLATFFADTIGAGNSIFTEGGKALIQGGLGQLSSAMDDLAAKTNAGTASEMDYVNYVNRFIDEVDANAETLKMLAISGNAQAQQMIQARSQMRKLTAAEMADKAKEAKSRAVITKLFQSFESAWGRIRGAFLDKLISSIEPAMKKLDGFFAEGGGFDPIVDAAGRFGDWLGKMIVSVATPGNVEKIVSIITAVGSAALAVGKFAASMATYLVPIAQIVGWTVDVITSGIMSIHDMFARVNKTFADFVTAGAVAVAFIGGKFIKSMIGNFLSGMRMMNVRAGVVNIVGQNGTSSLGDILGGGNGGGSGGSGGPGRGGRGGGSGGGRLKKAFGALSSMFENIVKHPATKKFAFVAAAVGATFGAFSGIANAAEPTNPNEKEDASTARPVPFQFLHSDMIKDKAERAKYEALLDEQRKLKSADATNENLARTKEVSAELADMRSKYGREVSDLRDFNNATSRDSKLIADGMGKSRAIGGAAKAAPDSPAPAEKKEEGSNTLDWLQNGLSVAGFLPGIGTAADLTNAGISAVRGDWGGAAMSAIASIPMFGDIAALGKASKFVRYGANSLPILGGMFGGSANARPIDPIQPVEGDMDARAERMRPEPTQPTMEFPQQDQQIDLLKKMIAENEQSTKLLATQLQKLINSQEAMARTIARNGK